jgi:putative spermidine/putrescine transport system substrate-binding protein
MTKWMRLLAVIAVLALVAAACGDGDGDGDTDGGTDTGGEVSSGDPDEPPVTEVGDGEGEVNIIAWAGYIEDGSTEAA